MSDIPKTVDDWQKKIADEGLTGHATIITDIDGRRKSEIVDISEDAGVSRTQIPGDVIDHIVELLRERDRLVSATVKASMETLTKSFPDMATLRESCLKLAIEVIRKKYTNAPIFVSGMTKSIDSLQDIPEDMRDYVADIFTERDNLWIEESHKWWVNEDAIEYQEYKRISGLNPEWTRGMVMNAVLTPIAIEKIRQRIKESANG